MLSACRRAAAASARRRRRGGLALSSSSSAPPSASPARALPDDGLGLGHFVAASAGVSPSLGAAGAASASASPVGAPVVGADGAAVAAAPMANPSFFLETYGCQMNVSDSEIVAAVLEKAGMRPAATMEEAGVVLLNTCSIRENAEAKVWHRLREMRAHRRTHRTRRSGLGPQSVAVLGCMAERLKKRLLEEEGLVDLVAGPDAYRDLPRLLRLAEGGEEAVNTQLSLDETYSDIAPVRRAENNLSAFVSIMRGCDNMCSYCIVPFTRGRERSRDADSIVEEVRRLSGEGVREVTLLGQNVNSYSYIAPEQGSVPLAKTRDAPSRGFTETVRRRRHDSAVRFADLVDRVAAVDPEMRVRFTSPHPKDFPDELLRVIARRPNVCSQVHMPAQSGSSSVLERMWRGYTREAYLDLVQRMREIVPDVAISTDIIAGFCGETEEEHRDTITLMEAVRYDQAFMFQYSEREKTRAHRRFEDDVPADVKSRRLREVIDTFHRVAQAKSAEEVGRTHLVLVEGRSRRSEDDLAGRADNNRRVIFDRRAIPRLADVDGGLREGGAVAEPRAGDYVAVRVTAASSGHLRAEPLARTTLEAFAARRAEFDAAEPAAAAAADPAAEAAARGEATM